MKAKSIIVEVQIPTLAYLNKLYKMKCLSDILKVFSKTSNCAKELTESYAAYNNLRHSLGDLPNTEEYIYLHVGDGTYPRTSTMFAYLVGGKQISIDPELNIEWVKENLSDVRGLKCIKNEIEKVDLSILKNKKVILILVHSHVDTQKVMNQITDSGGNLLAVYINPCCQPKSQLLPDIEVKEDWGILSDERDVQVWIKEN